MKTYKEWDESGVDLDDFLDSPCEIDEEIYCHLAESSTPSYDDGVFMQIGEATSESPLYGTFTFNTIQRLDEGRYIHLGVLPAFKGSEYAYYDKIDIENL